MSITRLSPGIGNSQITLGKSNQRAAIESLIAGVATEINPKQIIIGQKEARAHRTALSNNSPSVLISNQADPSIKYRAGNASPISAAKIWGITGTQYAILKEFVWGITGTQYAILKEFVCRIGRYGCNRTLSQLTSSAGAWQ
jgi:hypothetical protein